MRSRLVGSATRSHGHAVSTEPQGLLPSANATLTGVTPRQGPAVIRSASAPQVRPSTRTNYVTRLSGGRKTSSGTSYQVIRPCDDLVVTLMGGHVHNCMYRNVTHAGADKAISALRWFPWVWCHRLNVQHAAPV